MNRFDRIKYNAAALSIQQRFRGFIARARTYNQHNLSQKKRHTSNKENHIQHVQHVQHIHVHSPDTSYTQHQYSSRRVNIDIDINSTRYQKMPNQIMPNQKNDETLKLKLKPTGKTNSGYSNSGYYSSRVRREIWEAHEYERNLAASKIAQCFIKRRDRGLFREYVKRY